MTTVKDVLDTELSGDQSILAVLDRTGDTKVTWSRSNPTEVEIARDAFNHARARGYMAYSVEGADGRRGTVLSEFDPTAERIVLAPPLKGGSTCNAHDGIANPAAPRGVHPCRQ